MKLRSMKFNKPGRVSHSWWEDLVGIAGNSVGSWFDLKGKEVDANAATAAANANANASILAAQLDAQQQENKTKTAYIIGGSIVAVVLVIVIAMIFKK